MLCWVTSINKAPIEKLRKRQEWSKLSNNHYVFPHHTSVLWHKRCFQIKLGLIPEKLVSLHNSRSERGQTGGAALISLVHACCDGGDSIQQQDATSSLHYNESWNSNIASKLSWCVRTKRLAAARITYLNKIGNVEKNNETLLGEKKTYQQIYSILSNDNDAQLL